MVAFCLLPTTAYSSGHRDTLAYFDRRDFSAFYQDPTIAAQASRFDLAAPAYLRKVTLWLSGGEVGTAHVTIYGNEGAFAAPLLGQPLSRAFEIRKTRKGVEAVTLELPDNIFIDRPQFFVVVSNLSSGVRLLSDKVERGPLCQAGANRWFFQALQKTDGSWVTGKYAYAISTVVDVPESFSLGYLTDITGAAEFSEDVVQRAAPNRSISWEDVNDDGRFDVLVGGRLHLNRGDDIFEDFTEKSGLSLTDVPKAHVFVDVDNDRDPDILWIGQKEGGTVLYRNEGGEFEQQDLDLPAIANPITFSVADVNGDGYLDLFVGQGLDTAGQVLPSYVLINQSGRHYTATPLTSFLPESMLAVGQRSIQSAQWIDANRDGYPDLALTMQSPTWVVGESSVLLLSDEHGRFSGSQNSSSASIIERSSRDLLNGRVSVPSDWGDVDGDGQLEELQPTAVSATAVRSGTHNFGPSVHDADAGTAILNNHPFESFAGAGIWGDVDNDGRLDALVTSACNCRFASLYLQEKNGEAFDRSFEYGLFRIPAGNDAVWVDYNGDGLLDLSTFVNGRFHLYKNTLNERNGSVEVDLSNNPNPSGMNGGTVEVHAGDSVFVRPIYSGRGVLMQGPPVLHFGIGTIAQIDSIVYNPVNGGDRIAINANEVNKVYRLFSDRVAPTSNRAELTMAVSPNPFTSVLRFNYSLSAKSRMELHVYSLDGTPVATLINEEKEGGSHQYEWKPLDRNGASLPAGTYVWRAVVGPQTITGRAVLAK